jgi:2-phosphoglycerate kinase
LNGLFKALPFFWKGFVLYVYFLYVCGMNLISLINMKGGVGKTTIATNLADCLSRRNGKKILLVDSG